MKNTHKATNQSGFICPTKQKIKVIIETIQINNTKFGTILSG